MKSLVGALKMSSSLLWRRDIAGHQDSGINDTSNSVDHWQVTPRRSRGDI
jgi:hypothetical protein